jgi:hypothetical protein
VKCRTRRAFWIGLLSEGIAAPTIGALFSLYVVPVIYSYIAEVKERIVE